MAVQVAPMALLFGAVPVAVVCYKAFWAHGHAGGIGPWRGGGDETGIKGHRVLTPGPRQGVDARPCGRRGGSLGGCLLGGRLLSGDLLSGRLLSSLLVKTSL